LGRRGVGNCDFIVAEHRTIGPSPFSLIDVMNFACETIVVLRLRLPWDDTLFIFFKFEFYMRID
jgi:hypothetical protein